jgi:molecular chaperone HscB
MTRDLFEVLGVDPRFHVSEKQLHERYLALSKELHPDRFAKATPRERLLAVTRTTELNDAWRVLRDQVKRAEYLLKREGLDVADEKSSVKADPGLLAQMMELNEELSEALGQEPKVKELVARVDAEREHALRLIDDQFHKYEEGDRGVLPGIAQALIALRYLTRFRERTEGAES